MRSPSREIAKRLAHALALLVVTPSVVSFLIRSRLIGPDNALAGSTQAWAIVPGLAGQYLRRAFLSRALGRCARTATIEFGTIFSVARARIDDRAYVGPRCHLGWVHIESDVLIAAGVHVPSGSQTHGISDLSRPIREQPGAKRCVRIGSGAWIGSAAVIMADVGRNTIVAAGAVVTTPLPDGVIAGGVPARILRSRSDAKATA
jgi:virginiamycin A acetyltransferase